MVVGCAVGGFKERCLRLTALLFVVQPPMDMMVVKVQKLGKNDSVLVNTSHVV